MQLQVTAQDVSLVGFTVECLLAVRCWEVIGTSSVEKCETHFSQGVVKTSNAKENIND